ncbi:hypothetical protein AB0H83_24970 [Dactylosporangium sp. NPDC050688]|uniref:hypothetical protein n=1 Tax=Dactylosporangium sp. NPDC050688 TaxID=3157217 RepID=UPI0033C969D8
MNDLATPIPPISKPLHCVADDLIEEAQRLPELYAAGGAERIVSLKDRVWFKVKTGRWRGAATRLPEADRPEAAVQVRFAPWWMGAAGYRREGDPADFYSALESDAGRSGGSDKWLPSDWDWKRLELEQAYAWEAQIRTTVRGLIARSLRNGRTYLAEFRGYSVTALAQARGGETYLKVGLAKVADPKIFAVILNAVPGVDPQSWMPEPSDVAGMRTESGEIIWSTILPPAVAAGLLDEFPQ